MTATTSEQSESRTPLYRRKGVVIPAIIVGLVTMAVAWWLLAVRKPRVPLELSFP